MNRSKVITLALVSVFLIVGEVVSTAQERTSSEQLQNKAGSDDVDQILEGLKLKRQDVVATCLENCEKQGKNTDKVTDGGIIYKARPQYSPIAVVSHASGEVVVLIVINEEGKVIAAKSMSRHPLLQATAVRAAIVSTFNPYLVDGVPVKVIGTLTYDFVLNN